MIGSRLSHYVVEVLLGEGGMGAVYRARDTLLNRSVALKVLSSSAADSESRRRLLREARAACALNHPNVVTVHAVEQEADVDFIVMEWIDGAPLASSIPPRGLPVQAALDYGIQIASALAVAHDAGLIHRDVKPGNVMVTPDGIAKVVDFGIARQTARPDDATRLLTFEHTGAIDAALTGTPGYLSPEQIQGKPPTPRSDVFALGVLLFEMLTGQQPFHGDTTWSKIDSTIHQEPPPLRSLRSEVPDALARIVAQCLSKTPEQRYASAREVRDALRDVAANQKAAGHRTGTRAAVAAGLALALLGGGAVVWSRVRESRLTWARETAVAEARRLAGAGDVVAAYKLARQALAAAPNDPQVVGAWNDLTTPVSVDSVPSGADVAFAAYGNSAPEWISVGQTPTNTRLPVGQLRWRVSKRGYDAIEISPTFPAFLAHLVATGSTPAGMVYVPAGEFEVEHDSSTVNLPDYWLDKYEVTNRAYKQFVEQGGYGNPEYWKEAFVKDGIAVTQQAAMAQFVDSTGRAGPSTWELGTFPEGQDEWPVSGVSWYEAAAYCKYAGKQLPTTYHWYNASGSSGVFSEILRFSNFGGRGTVRVGSGGGLGPYGAYDMAGNVKEWCWNQATGGRRYVAGGAWNDANYQFHDEDAQPPFERRSGYGIRCMSQKTPFSAQLLEPIVTLVRDPGTLKPVNDELFEAYRRLYDYDPMPLESRVDEVQEITSWRRERVSFSATYGGERVSALLYLPRGVSPPYQSVVYFPGSDAVRLQSSRAPWLLMTEFIVRSGRALVYPIYQQTYERRRQPGGPNFLREISIQRGQDLRRTIDYIQSRTDFNHDKIAFYGLSLGAQLGPVYLAIEPRLRAGVLLSGGFETWTIPPETDPVNFAPRVRQPVLMVNGRDDFDLPYKEAQLPLFQALGTPASDKRHAVLEGGHIPPRPQEVYKEVLDWLDRYLGPVR